MYTLLKGFFARQLRLYRNSEGYCNGGKVDIHTHSVRFFAGAVSTAPAGVTEPREWPERGLKGRGESHYPQ